MLVGRSCARRATKQDVGLVLRTQRRGACARHTATRGLAPAAHGNVRAGAAQESTQLDAQGFCLRALSLETSLLGVIKLLQIVEKYCQFYTSAELYDGSIFHLISKTSI